MISTRIAPVTRIEGHLDIEVDVDYVNGQQQVVDVKSSGTTFRGLELMLKNRDPRAAPAITQRICGVCPVSHAMASSLNLESAFGITAPDNGRIVRNLVLGANFIMSHVLHFYHLALVDFINTEGIVDMSPWVPRYVTPDMLTGDAVSALVGHYVQALVIQTKAHQMCATFGAKLSCVATFVPGGCTEEVTAEKISDFRSLLAELRGFIDDVYMPDVLALADAFSEYFGVGAGCGNLLAYGAFDLDERGTTKLLSRGRYVNGAYRRRVNPDLIAERVDHAWYPRPHGPTPAEGEIQPLADESEGPAPEGMPSESMPSDGTPSAESPMYASTTHEVGALARMLISYLGGQPSVVGLVDSVLGDFGAPTDSLFSVLGRHAAHAMEAKFVADSMDGWLDELEVGGPTYDRGPIPDSGEGVGLTEAPRGALGHWIEIRNRKIASYQVVTPTNWNASPKDDGGRLGPIGQALIGTPVSDTDKPIEVLRVVHSFDPCLACSVHLTRPGGAKKLVLNV